MTAVTRLVHEFAQLMSNRRGNEFDCWITQVREASMLELELELECGNGPIEGINTKTKRVNDRCMAVPASHFCTTESYWHRTLFVTT